MITPPRCGTCHSPRVLGARGLLRWAVLVLVCGFASLAHGQWIQQQIALKPGWNAVFLEVDPSPQECDALFAGLPVESAWDFNRTGDSAQFVQDPSTLIPGTPGWLTWFPPSHPLASQVSLFILRDGRPYLIKLADSAVATTWTVTGKPSLRRLRWQAGAVNFVGFRVGTSPPTFAALFAGEAGLAGQPVYRLGAAGAWEPVLNLTSTGPRSAEAYWVRCQSPATRTGTIEVNTGSRQGLLFGRDTTEQSVRIRNTSAGVRSISLRLLPSAAPPAGQVPVAGPAPLEHRDANYAQAQFDWKPLTQALTFSALSPGAEWNVRLAVRRAGQVAARPGSEFQSVLEVTDDAGTRWLVPVSASAGSAPGSARLLHQRSSGGSNTRPGLWVGEAVINAVSQPAHPGDPLLPRRAGGSFQFRLIVHVDAAGVAHLLQHVFLVREPPTFKPDPENPGFEMIDEPARTVVVTDEALIPQSAGTGEIIGRRASSAAFGFKEPLALGGGEFGAGTLTAAVALEYDHPLNPFKHVYHPDHDNLDERFDEKLPEGREAFTVTRSLSLEFTATDPLGLNPPSWGDTEVGGVYRETINGLHRNAIQVSGDFRLLRVLPAAALNE